MPLATGAAVALNRESNYFALTQFTIAALSLFWLRTPAEALAGASAMRVRDARERRLAISAVVILVVIALGSLTALFWGSQHFGLFAIGFGAALSFAVQSVLKKRGRSYRAIAQVIGSIGLTSTAASAYYILTGKLDSIALTLWAVNWLFASEQIQFVQMRIRGTRLETAHERLSKGKYYLVTAITIGITVTLFAIIRIVPWLMAVAFIPAAVRSAMWFTSNANALDVHKLGWLELANAFVFALALITIFRIS